MTGAICTRLRTSLVLLGFLALMQGLPRCKSEKQCYQLRLDRPDHNNPCNPTFPDNGGCDEHFLDTITITNATVTVNALLDPYDEGSKFTATVDATDAANSIVRCDTYTCGSLAFILLANYSTQYCLGVHPDFAFAATIGISIAIDALVSVNYTMNNAQPGAFQETMSGRFLSDLFYHGGILDAKLCNKFRRMVTGSGLYQPPPNGVIETRSCSEDPTSTLETTTDSNFELSSEFQTKTSRGTTADPKTSSSQKTTYSTQSCGNLVSEEISVDELGGNQQCGSTFTFHFSSLNVTNVTVRYAYIPRDEISGNADDVQLASTDQEGSVVRVISTVIEINLLDGNTTIRLTDGSLDIIFKIDSTEDFPPNNDSSVVHCAYMVNESTWSTEGLRVVSVNSDSVVCHSSHLTSFAVLLSVKPPEGIHATVQSYMSYLLGAISITSLTLAVLIYCVTGTYKILKIQIHMNLAISTALGQLLFITMAESTRNRAICKVVAVTLHFLFTATLAWTMIEGVILYRTTAVGFKPLKIGWLSLIAWGSSLVVVGVSFGIRFDTYGQSNYCWLYAEDYTIYIFAACVFGTELFSFVVLWFVMRVFNSLKANKNKDGIDKFKATARALFIILPIIGLTWLAGTITSISASDDVIPFQYIFIITFSLQGVCILVFHCLMVPDVKTAIKLRMNRRVSDKSWANSKSTKSTASSTL